ncbi:putative Heterokaryon incompatibility domain-containing protein [Seiridium cardinale]
MSNDPPPFVYEPLRPGEVRLLTAATSDTNVTRWRLDTVNLEKVAATDLDKFEALSYTWGDLSETFALICNARTLRIHKNLHDALPFLARPSSSRPLWIDAICINQLDETEKLAQVRLMHRIYRQASKVWIWLGNDTEYSGAAISLLPQLARLGRTLDQSPPARWSNSHSTLASIGLPDPDSPVWAAVRTITCNDWFRRVWTVQEFVLARHVSFMCGPHELESELVIDAVFYANRLESFRDAQGLRLPIQGIYRNTAMARIKMMTALDRIEQAKTPFRPVPGHLIATISYMTGHHRCREAKDRVWGVLGLLEEHQAAALRVKDDMSVSDLYIRLSRHIFTHSDRTRDYFWRLLDRAALGGKRAGLPSWCPDYHQELNERMQNSICQLRSKGKSPYHASRAVSSIKHAQDPNHLSLTATVFDSILHVYPLTPLPPTPIRDFSLGPFDFALVSKVVLDLQTFLHAVVEEDFRRDVSTAIIQHDGVKKSNHVQMEVLWRTLIGNITTQNGYEITGGTFSRFRASIDEFLARAHLHRAASTMQGQTALRACKNGSDEPSQAVEALLDSESPFMQFLGPLWICMQNRRLFMTARGRLGFGSMHVEEGDNVCIISGSRTAHVLRPANHGGTGNHNFLGEAYVHGMMNGEIETLKVEEQRITLI